MVIFSGAGESRDYSYCGACERETMVIAGHVAELMVIAALVAELMVITAHVGQKSSDKNRKQ